MADSGYFDDTYFDSTYFDTGDALTGGRAPKRIIRRQPDPELVIQLEDDELLALL